MIDLLVKDIKKKNEYSSLDDNYVKSILEEYLRKNKDVNEKLNSVKNYELFTRSKTHEEIIKAVRSSLRKKYGLYKQGKPKNLSKELYLLCNAIKEDGLESKNTLSQTNKVLSLHLSTKERLTIYGSLYSEIWDVTGKPKSILDLGCGLNPISLPFMNLPSVEYYANELVDEDCEQLEEYFSSIKDMKYKLIKNNLLDLDNYDFPKVDVCFIWKTLDVLEKDKRDISLEIIKKINADWFVLSFARRSVGGKKLISSWRWVEKKVEGIVKKLEYDNEVFFIVKKNK